MKLIKRTAAVISAMAAFAAAVPVIPSPALPAAVQQLQAEALEPGYFADFSNYDLYDFDTVYRLRQSYGDVIYSGGQCLIINMITEASPQSDDPEVELPVIEFDNGWYTLSGSAKAGKQDIYSRYCTMDHYSELTGIDYSTLGRYTFSYRWHCTVLTAQQAGDLEVDFDYSGIGGSKEYHLIVNDDRSITPDIDYIDLTDFVSVHRIQNAFGSCLISGKKALIIERMEGEDAYDRIDIATVPFTVEKTADYDRKEEYTDTKTLSGIAYLETGERLNVYDDRKVKYHTMAVDPKSDGYIYIDFEFDGERKTDNPKTVDLKIDKELNISLTNRNYPTAGSEYDYLNVVDFSDYGQLQYILRKFAGYEGTVCVTYGEDALFLAEHMSVPGGDDVFVDMDFAVSDKSGNTGDVKIQKKGTVPVYGHEDEPQRIAFFLVSGLRPGDLTVDFLQDGAAARSFELTVGDDYSISGKNDPKVSNATEAAPGELIEYPQNDRQYRAMLEAYPEGYRVNSMEKSVFFIEPYDDNGDYDEDIAVNCNNRYSVKRNKYGFIFSPGVFGSYKEAYVVSGLHMTKETINCSIEVVAAGDVEYPFVWVDRKCDYYYPVRRDYIVKYPKNGELSVELIDNFSGRSQKDLDKIYNEALSGSGAFSDSYVSGDIDTLLDNDYYMFARTQLEVNDFFSFTDYYDESGDRKDNSKYITMRSFEPNFYNKPYVSGNAEISDIFTGGSLCEPFDEGGYVQTTDIRNYYVLTPTADGLAEMGIEGGMGSDVFTVTNGMFEPEIGGTGCIITEGDFNLDGDLGIADLVTAKRYLLGYTGKLTATQKICADVCRDGAIDGFDLTLLREMLLETVMSVPDLIN